MARYSFAMIRFWVSVIAVTYFLASSSSIAQTASSRLATDLEQRLKNQLLSLRIPSASNKLHFDTNGLPVGKQERGVASLDREIVVKSIKVANSTVTIEGERVYRSWDPVSSQFVGNLPQIKVEVVIDVPHGDVSEATVSPAFNKVFLSTRESEQRRCSSAETTASHTFLTDWLYRVDAVQKAPATSKSELDSICFPSGERGYSGKGMQFPKVISAPDPKYSESARQRRIQGTAIYAIVVDQQGLVSDVLLVRSIDPALNYEGAIVLRKWRFQPATFQGETLPAALHVQVNFKLH
jgi:TonB family protein